MATWSMRRTPSVSMTVSSFKEWRGRRWGRVSVIVRRGSGERQATGPDQQDLYMDKWGGRRMNARLEGRWPRSPAKPDSDSTLFIVLAEYLDIEEPLAIAPHT